MRYPCFGSNGERRLRVRVAVVLCATLLATTLGGCVRLPSPGFEIVGEGRQIAGRSYILSRNNRLSVRTVSGEMQFGNEGLFANPAFVNGAWFLLMENVANVGDKSVSANRFNNIIGLVFSVDGQSFSVEPSDYDFLTEDQLMSVSSRSAKAQRVRNADFGRETATFQLTEDQLISVINAEQLEVMVVGSARRAVFTQDGIASNFQANLFDFYHAAKLDEAGSAGS